MRNKKPLLKKVETTEFGVMITLSNDVVIDIASNCLNHGTSKTNYLHLSFSGIAGTGVDVSLCAASANHHHVQKYHFPNYFDIAYKPRDS